MTDPTTDITTLLVDDDRAHLDVTRQFLDRTSDAIDADVTTDPEAAVTEVTGASDGYDCVVCDYNMPAMTGLEVLEAIRDGGSDVPFILYTGRGSEEIASQAISAGVTDYVQKEPGTEHYRVLANRIENAAVQRHTREELGRTTSKIEALHDVATEIASCTDRERLCSLIVDASENILEFDVCMLSRYEDHALVPAAVSEATPTEGYYTETPVDAEDSIAARCYRRGVSDLTSDVREADTAPEEPDFLSALTVPLDDFGVFQAVAREVDGFSERDLELAEILVSHANAALSRIEADEKRDRERERFETLFEESPHPIAVGRLEDGTPTVVAVNSAFESVFGWDQETLEGENIDDYVAPDASDAGESSDTLVQGDNIRGREVRRRTADDVRDFLLYTDDLLDDGDERFAVYTDVTDLKQRERELRAQNERLEELTSFVSHDLKNPLNAADGYARLLAEETDRPELASLQAAIETLDHRVDELQALTTGSRSVFDMTDVDLETVVERAWGNVDTPAATLRVGDLPARVEGDPDRLVRLVENLVSNAVQHGGADVTVTVDALPDEQGFYVADDGVGVDEPERLFDADATDVAGVGTSIVRTIAATHGWEIDATTGDQGGLRVELRVAEAKAAPPSV